MLIKYFVIGLIVVWSCSCSLLNLDDHTSISKRLKNYKYDRSLRKLKNKVKGFLKDGNGDDAPIFMVSMYDGSNKLGFHRGEMSKKLDGEFDSVVALEDGGFFYKNKFYMNRDIGVSLSDLVLRLESSKKEILNSLKYGDIHLVEDSPSRFVWIKGGHIISGTKVKENLTKLKVCTLSRVVVGKPSQRLGYSRLYRMGYSIFDLLGINKPPVYLDRSLKFCERNRTLELELFYYIDKKLFNKWLNLTS